MLLSFVSLTSCFFVYGMDDSVVYKFFRVFQRMVIVVLSCCGKKSKVAMVSRTRRNNDNEKAKLDRLGGIIHTKDCSLFWLSGLALLAHLGHPKKSVRVFCFPVCWRGLRPRGLWRAVVRSRGIVRFVRRV